MTVHRTSPDAAEVHASGWAEFEPGWEVTRLPLVDSKAGGLFARLTYRDAMAAAARLGGGLPTAAQMDRLHLASIVLRPYPLPAGPQMTSLEWSQKHDAAVWAALSTWDRDAPVAGAGKHWIAGAPAGRAHLMGWWAADVRRFGSARSGPGWVQQPSQPGSPGPHLDSHHDYGTTTLLVRPALHDTDPAPRPGAGWLASVLDGGRSVAAEAADVLRGLLASDGANPTKLAPEPPRTKPMPTFPADLPCVNSVIRAAGYRPTRRGKVRLVVLHTAECAETAKSAEAVAGYFASLKDRAASAHFCVDSDSIVQCVPLSGTAWAAPGANDDGVQIELAGYAGQGAAGWADAYSVAMLDRAATLVAQLCERYSLPVAYVDEAGLLTGLAGVTTHAAVSRAWKRSTHTDPGPTFPLVAFLDSVRAKLG